MFLNYWILSIANETAYSLYNKWAEQNVTIFWIANPFTTLLKNRLLTLEARLYFKNKFDAINFAHTIFDGLVHSWMLKLTLDFDNITQQAILNKLGVRILANASWPRQS